MVQEKNSSESSRNAGKSGSGRQALLAHDASFSLLSPIIVGLAAARRAGGLSLRFSLLLLCPTAVAFHAQVGTASSPRAHRLVAPGRQRRLSTTPQMAAADSSGLPFVPPPALTGLFVGSGSDGLNEPAVAQAILSLVPKLPADVAVLYLGTATYDLPGPRERQTARFIEAGCRVRGLEVVDVAPPRDQLASAVEAADVIIVSGGNTLFAVSRWVRLGLEPMLRAAMLRGAVLTGGSAGAICWFQGGHSDSMDPDTYKAHMLADATRDKGGDESSAAPAEAHEKRLWEYIRVDGLGFLPGLVCPHHDKVQSNGLLRASDFDDMLLRHSTEIGIGIDHWAALQICEGRFKVLSLADKEGSVLPDGSFSPERKGTPGVWIKEVRKNAVHSRLCPPEGAVQDLLRVPVPCSP